MTNQPTDKDAPRQPVSPKPQGSSASPSEIFAAAQSNAPHEEVLIRKRKRKKKKKKKIAVGVIIAVAVVALVGGGAWAVQNIINSGEKAVQDATQEATVETSENAISYDEGKTVTYNGHTYELNPDMVSVLMIGYDRESPAEEGAKAGQSDALIVMALDTKTGKATAIGVPRDSMVLVDQYAQGSYIGQQTEQICLAYSYGNGGSSSSENAAKAVSRALYNIPISYYFSLDLSGIGPLNDSIGGVALTPLQSIPGTNIVEDQSTVLFGTNARRYVQYRDTSILTSALDRQERQVQYVKAFAAQTLSMAKEGGVGTFVDLYNTAMEYSITNLGLNEFSYLASSVVSSGIAELDMTTLPGSVTQGEKYAEFNLDTDAVYEVVLDTYYRQVS